LVDPIVRVEKNINGKIGLKGISVPSSTPSGSSAAGTSSSEDKAFQFLMKSMDIKNAAIYYEDFSVQPPLKASILNLDVSVNDFSQTQPFSIKAKGGLLSPVQNISVDAKIMLPSGSDPGFAENVTVSTDLSSLNWKEMSVVIPALASSGLEGLPKGRVRLIADKISFDPNALDKQSANLRWEDGWIKHRSTQSAIENIDLSLTLSGPDLTVDSFSSTFAKGIIKATARSQHFRTQPLTAVRWSSQDLAIDELTPKALDSRAPKLGGRLSLDFEGQAAGVAWPQISQTLSGQGQVALKDGVLLNYNVLREVIQKISIIPGAEDAIKNRLPGIYQAKLNESGTILKPLTIPFTMQNGQLFFSQLALDTDFLAIRGSGQAGLDKTISAKCVVLLDRDLSAAIAASVPQTQLLMNSNSNLEIPVQIQGQFPQIMILPDTDYIGSKLLATKATELVTGMIQDPEKGIDQVKNLLKGTTDAGGKSGNDLLNSLLGDTSQQQQPQQSSNT
jgi:hypothetical protein